MNVNYPDLVKALLTDAENVTPHEKNPSSGDVDAVIESVRSNGCYRPIYASQATGKILAGHTLYNALLTLKQDRIPVQWIEGLDREGELRIVLADNKVAELARRDDGLVIDLLNDVGTAGTGYTDEELLDLKAAEAVGFKSGMLDDDDMGEGLKIGEQRVLCPDCGHEFTVDKEF